MFPVGPELPKIGNKIQVVLSKNNFSPPLFLSIKTALLLLGDALAHKLQASHMVT